MKKWIIPLAMAAGLIAGNASAQTWVNRIQSQTAPANQFQTGISASGVPQFSAIGAGAMPAFIGGDCTTSAGSVVLSCIYTNGYTGSATQTIKSRLDTRLLATSFTGVDATGSTDSTTGLRAAFAAMVTSGKTLYFPCGNYKISGSGAEIFLVTNAPVNVEGANKGCVTFKTAGVGASTDIIHHSLTTLVYGSHISGVSVDGAGGRNPYRLDANASGFLYGARFVNNGFYVAGAASFYLNGNSGGNGAIGHSTIGEDSNLSAVTCVYCGDRLVVTRSIFSGPLAAFDGSFVLGAASFTFSENTVSNSGGCVVLRSGAYPRIINNEFEVVTAGSPPNNACIDFWGNTGRIYGGEFKGNTLSVLAAAGSPGPDAIRIDTADSIQVEGNRISLYYFGSAYHLRLTANAAALPPMIGGLNKFEVIASGSASPLIYNASGYRAGCAPPMDGDTSKFLRQLPGGSICGSFSNLIVSDLPLPYSAGASGTAPTVALGFCTGAGVSASNGTVAFAVYVGTGCAANNGVLTMPAAATRWACDVESTANYAAHKPAAIPGTSTQVTIYNYSRTTGAATNFTSSDILNVKCSAY